MKKQQKRSDKNIIKKKKILVNTIVFAVIILFISTNIVYAKYITTDKYTSKFSVATPIFRVEGEEIARINDINNVGYYEFSIKNFNESKISEVGFLYTIEIISDTDESIQFELYNQESQIPLNNLRTGKLLIKGNEKQEQKYKLKVIYDEIDKNLEKSIEEKVQIKVCSEQVKI